MGWKDFLKPEAGFNPFAVASNMASEYIASREQRKATEQTNETNLGIAREQMAMQKEFAQMGVRWKAEDATAAGLHPMAALGAVTSSYQPSFPNITPDYSRADMVRSMGQNISRAVSATKTMEERAAETYQLENMRLQNRLLQKQIDQIGPPFPSHSVDPNLSGQGDVAKGVGVNDGRVVDAPFVRVVSDARAPHKEAGAIPDIQVVRTKNGYAVVPGKDVKERIEDSPMEWQWLMRNVTRFYDMPDGRLGFMHPVTGNLVPIKPWAAKLIRKFRR